MPNIVLNKQVKANLKILFGFLHERQEIWHKRFVLHKRPPWTKDKILQTNHFTNVYREIDPGTVYWFDTIYNNFHDDPKQLLYATMIYRMCNRQSTFEYLEDKQPFPFWNEKETIKYFCEYFAEAPDPKFTSAHIVSFKRPAGKVVSRWVRGYKGLYRVTNTGKVIRLKRKVKITRPSGIYTQTFNRKETFGYRHYSKKSGQKHLAVKLTKDGVSKNVMVASVVLEAFRGSCPEGMEACHTDGDATNNNLNNLRWDTRSENLKDIKKYNPDWRAGENNGQSRLTWEIVKEAKKLKAEGWSYSKLGKKYGVVPECISQAVRGISWKSKPSVVDKSKPYTKTEGYLASVRQLAPMIPKLYKAITKAKTLRRVHAILCDSVSGIGGFIAYEIIQCLIFAGILKQSINSWANVGPGCERGMRIVFGEQTESWNRSDFEKVLNWVHRLQVRLSNMNGIETPRLPSKEDIRKAFGKETCVSISGADSIKPLSLLCIESSFCEISKYFRCMEGGHTRMKYKPVIQTKRIFNE